jgi:hypothetical protein
MAAEYTRKNRYCERVHIHGEEDSEYKQGIYFVTVVQGYGEEVEELTVILNKSSVVALRDLLNDYIKDNEDFALVEW